MSDYYITEEDFNNSVIGKPDDYSPNEKAYDLIQETELTEDKEPF